MGEKPDGSDATRPEMGDEKVCLFTPMSSDRDVA